jgi:oxygen-dependent protoporphyrinogen oxidase
MHSQNGDDSWTVSERRRFVVIGGGISGLSAAYKLYTEFQNAQEPTEVLLFEGSPRLGGCISTYNLDDTILELGPDSFITEKPAALDLCKRLGIENRLVQTDKQHRRTMVAHDNQLYPVPEGFLLMAPTEILPMLSSPLFSWEAKLRMMGEPFISPMSEGLDESLQQFTERRFGREVFERIVQPLVGGIYTADPAKLSVRAALPRIASLEQQYGSLIKGLAATRKKSENDSGARYSMFVTFDEGMNVMVNAILNQLPRGTVNTHRLVSRVRKTAHGSGYEIECFDGKVVHADGVVIATSAYHASDILGQADMALANDLRGIEYASSAVLNLIYRRSDIPHALDAFGFVVPAKERRTILACSFSSVKWPGRAPADKVLLRVFVGGALQPDVYDLTDEQIECLMWEDLHTYLGINAVPLMSVISRFPRAMPQYNVGHIERMKRVELALEKFPGLALAGNAYYGVGVPDCISSGERAADKIMQYASQASVSTRS